MDERLPWTVQREGSLGRAADPPRAQATATGRFLGNFIQHHLEFIPKGRDQLFAL